MTEQEYRTHDGISRSDLWKIRESPEKFKYAMEHPAEPTPALVFGQTVHKLVLELDTFGDEFAVSPDVDRRTKDGKAEFAAFIEANEQKTIISSADYEKAAEMAQIALNAPFVAKLLNGEREKPLFWSDADTGEACKVRLDCLTQIKDRLVIVDYKTTADASTEAFMASAVKYGYDFQAAMYSEAVKTVLGVEPIFVFIAQEKEAPYAVNILQAEETFIKRGYDVFRELLGIYHECKESGEWYGYLGKFSAINNLTLPAWLAKAYE